VTQTGEAFALVAGTGRATVFGAAASALSAAQAPSPFQRDLHAFGLLIARLTLALVLVVRAALAVPFTPLGPHLGFEPPPPTMLAVIAAITLAYLAAAEATKPFAIRAAAGPAGTVAPRLDATAGPSR